MGTEFLARKSVNNFRLKWGKGEIKWKGEYNE